MRQHPANDSNNTAYGSWTDAIYLSSDNAWDLGDKLPGKVDHTGTLVGGGSYTGSLTAKLPPLKDGNWRIIVRPDLFNDVFEGAITYTATGLNDAPVAADVALATAEDTALVIDLYAYATDVETPSNIGGGLGRGELLHPDRHRPNPRRAHTKRRRHLQLHAKCQLQRCGQLHLSRQ